MIIFVFSSAIPIPSLGICLFKVKINSTYTLFCVSVNNIRCTGIYMYPTYKPCLSVETVSHVKSISSVFSCSTLYLPVFLTALLGFSQLPILLNSPFPGLHIFSVWTETQPSCCLGTPPHSSLDLAPFSSSMSSCPCFALPCC